ncbi:transcription factor PIL1-like [Gastrolobium bilobum]|uniref:transcription factor PIL1-like n=1 Tax=Gastrolobium bilobum TaxID=150636 RepID=UPI002AB1F316|nr:transcription factor PIL1-like [Gastrolobium bilobum]
MTEKMLDSTHPGMNDQSCSHLASIYGKDFLELVWGNGQILVQGGSSSRTRKTPSCTEDSKNPSRKEGAIDEDASIAKRTQRDSDLSSSNQSNGQDSQSKSSSKLNEESAYLTPIKDSKLIAGATSNSHLCTYSSQQSLHSAPLKKPRMESSQTPATNSQKQYLGCDQRTRKVNFANFLIPAVFLKPIYEGNNARVEEIEVGKVEKAEAASTSSKDLDHSTLIESAKGSQGLTGFQEQTSLTANKSNPALLVERSMEPPFDEHSEAAGHNCALGNKTSSSEAVKGRGKANTNLCSEPFLASSSVCSLGASNDPNFGSRKHEDTDGSTYLSDSDEEPEEDMVKQMPVRQGNRIKRSRNPEIHNLTERKRRDKINKKMRTLQDLIPNCNKVDKASMLDDAIQYLKTLKLHLQIMSMGSGLCMPLMMLPTTAHHINAPNLPQMMGVGMGFRPGTGIPCNPTQFPIPPQSGITDNGLQMFGFSNQIPFMPIPYAPFIPSNGNSSTEPLLPTNLAEHLANSVPKNSNLHAKAECATKQARNYVSLHHSISHPFGFPTTTEEKMKMDW